MKARKFLGVISRQKPTVCAVMLAMATMLFSQSPARANRIAGETSSRPMAIISGTLHPLTRLAIDLGEVNPGMQMETLVLNTSLNDAQRKDLDALLQALQGPGSPEYHKWLTQEQFGARYGLTEADLDKALGWLTAQRLTVKRVARSRNAIYFSGTAERVAAAFHTQLHHYQFHGRKHYANATRLEVPEEIASLLLNVRGLDNFRPNSNLHKKAATPNYTYGSTQHYLTPGDWMTIYNLIPVYNSGYDGSGIHVGVVGQTYAPPADIEKFTQNAGIGEPHLDYVCISTADCTDTAGISSDDWMEADVDIEWVAGMAPGATVDYVYAAGNDTTQDVFSALQHAIQDYQSSSGLVLPVISMSYTECETNLALTQAVLFDQMGAQASAQGQTLIVSSGDSGAAGCDAHDSNSVTTAAKGISAEAPADSPNFTAVGGTQFSGDVSDPTSYWNPVPLTQVSAQSYIPETSWNETSTNGLNASGGGQSTLRNGSRLEFPLPTWQSGLISGATGRLIPDIAFTAAQHDGYIGCAGALDDSSYGQMCSSGWYSSGGSDGSLFYYFFGTSLAAPSFAGALAVMEQSLGPQGNINPKLYQLAKNPQSYATVFHDITTGNNVVPCRAGTSGCVNGVMGYVAKTGYDMVTGLGSIDGNALFLALGGLDLNGTSVTIGTTPNLLRLGDQVTLNAQIVSLTGTGKGLIGGTVTFKMGNTVLGTAAVSNGSATLANVMVSAANGFTNGPDTITARYNGDPTYAPSNGSTTLSVSATPFASSTTVYAAPNPAPLGYTVTLNAWVASTISGLPFSGNVTFKVGSTILGTAAVSGQTAVLGNVTASGANGFSGGTNTITATYGGDANFAPSSGTDTLSLSATRSATTITANSGSSLPLLAEGSATGFSATVTSAGPGTPSGMVTFSTGMATLGTVTLGAWDAPAAVSNVFLTVSNGLGSGTDIVTITYAGDAFFLPSSTSFVVTVYNTAAPLLSPIGGAISAGGTGAQFLLHGANFTPGSVALWIGAARPTSYTSSTQLIITLSSTDVAQEGTYLIAVANPPPDAGTSAAQPIAVQLWPPAAKISGVSIAPAGTGSGNYVLTVTGANISSYQPVVQWNGKNLPGSYISPWQISAVITASDYASRPATVQVTNGYGGESSAFVLH